MLSISSSDEQVHSTEEHPEGELFVHKSTGLLSLCSDCADNFDEKALSSFLIGPMKQDLVVDEHDVEGETGEQADEDEDEYECDDDYEGALGTMSSELC